MFLRTEQEVKYYMRRSKGGKHHTYKRMRTIVVFQCDDCKGTKVKLILNV